MPEPERGRHLAAVDRLRGLLQAVPRSHLSRNAIWFTTLSGFERVVAVVQTVLISWTLGITEYGVYGLLFNTIGFVAASAGFQMGLAATVFVAKYRDAEKAKAAAVISVVSRFGWTAALAFMAFTLPFGRGLSEALVSSSDYQVAVMLGIVFVGVTIVGGVQDGVAQGFEMFVALARLKITAALLVLASIYPMAVAFGLNGVMVSILLGLVLKCVILERAINLHRKVAGVPKTGGGVSVRSLLGDFALPSMVVSLAIGFVTWLGLFLLSKQDAGFDQVAIVNTGLQWRGPVLLLTASLGVVAVPAFSRLSVSGDLQASRRLRRTLSLINLSVGAATALVMVAGSGLIMSLYGPGFDAGRLTFSLIVLSTIPSVVANVYLQELVGAARMWRQFWMHGPFLAALAAGFVLLVPRYHAAGYALSLLIGSSVLLAQVVAADTIVARRARVGAGAS